MRWQGRRQSDNIEDRRGSGSRMPGGSSGGPRIPLPRGKAGLVVIVIVVVAGFYGIDLTGFISGDPMGAGQTSAQQRPVQNSAQEQKQAEFTGVMLAETEAVWAQKFSQMNRQYREPKLVLYRGATPTGCGAGQAVMGPFYCPADQKVYIDLSFYDDMRTKLAAGGDFAQGYVVAHEVGHHVQHLLGIDSQVRERQQRSSQKEANRLSVKMELQADCFAGIWGHEMKNAGILEQGDLQNALDAAQAIGDDRLQKQSQGRVIPDSFTHGTSAQRHEWFKRGFDTGDIAQCDTFSALK
ncbi:neutral zinc metallopeptidase [Morganella psychrotolerans]|uniref:KPN_02809 family neutral zinc metallopeptidase n=1 Tax=Morganella psychrotolerans TaxID=368603 RepID=UPI0039AFEEB2